MFYELEQSINLLFKRSEPEYEEDPDLFPEEFCVKDLQIEKITEFSEYRGKKWLEAIVLIKERKFDYVKSIVLTEEKKYKMIAAFYTYELKEGGEEEEEIEEKMEEFCEENKIEKDEDGEIVYQEDEDAYWEKKTEIENSLIEYELTSFPKSKFAIERLYSFSLEIPETTETET